MRRIPPRRALLCLLLAATSGAALISAVGAPTASAASAAAHCPWMDGHLSPDRRAAMVVKRMTLAQKVGQLYGRGDITHYGAANYIPGIPALCVPDQISNDAGAGLGDAQALTTAFPDAIGQTAGWDPALAQTYGAALGAEAFAKGVNVLLAPGVDIARNPLNGRTFEYAGEDPYLAGQTAAAEISGHPVASTCSRRSSTTP